jgi:hypothetical protein
MTPDLILGSSNYRSRGAIGAATTARRITVLGVIGLLVATSSAMVFGSCRCSWCGSWVPPLPLGLFEGIAEVTTSLAKIVSGFVSD